MKSFRMFVGGAALSGCLLGCDPPAKPPVHPSGTQQRRGAIRPIVQAIFDAKCTINRFKNNEISPQQFDSLMVDHLAEIIHFMPYGEFVGELSVEMVDFLHECGISPTNLVIEVNATLWRNTFKIEAACDRALASFCKSVGICK